MKARLQPGSAAHGGAESRLPHDALGACPPPNMVTSYFSFCRPGPGRAAGHASGRAPLHRAAPHRAPNAPNNTSSSSSGCRRDANGLASGRPHPARPARSVSERGEQHILQVLMSIRWLLGCCCSSEPAREAQPRLGPGRLARSVLQQLTTAARARRKTRTNCIELFPRQMETADYRTTPTFRSLSMKSTQPSPIRH